MRKLYKKWLEEGQPKIFCKCPCKQEIIIQKHHRWHGIPEYIKGHNSKGIKNNNFGKKLSEETKQKMSKSHKGCIPWNKDKINVYSKETKEKISKTQTGKKLSEETKIKIGNGNKNKIVTKETKEKMSKAQSGDKNPAWRGGKSFEPYCKKFNEVKKEEIRNQYGRKCYICGKDEKDNITKTGKRPCRLSVHHIDADKEQGCNGKSWKLVPLCISCHARKKALNIIKNIINNVE